MKVKLPIIGQVLTGKDTEVSTSKGTRKKMMDVLGGLLQFNRSKLSNERTISSKLLDANTEWVYRNNDVIAKEVAQIEFELYSVGLKGGEVIYTEIDQHPLLDALDRFNDTTTQKDGVYITASHKKLTGDSFWLLDYSGNIINNIFLLPPDKVQLNIGNPVKGERLLVESYDYKDVIDGKKIERTFTPDQIIHFKTPNPKNMFRGYGAVEAAAGVIDIDNLTNLTSRKFFENGAITNFVLSTESKITDDQLKRLRAEVRQAYGGVDNAFKAMILGGGLKPERLSFTNKEMEYLGQLEWYRDKIMVIFGNTKASLGIIDDVNRASHESSIIAWKNNAVLPEMQAITDTLNEFLVPRFGDKLVLGFKDPIPEDRDAKLTEVEKAKSILSINERRGLLGYDTVPDGDTIPETESNRRADEMATAMQNRPDQPPTPKGLKYVNIKSVLRRNGLYKDKETWHEIKSAALPVAKRIIASRKKRSERPEEPRRHAQFTNEQVQAYWEKQIHIVEIIEQRFENSVRQFIDELEEKAVANLEREIASRKSVAFKNLYNEQEEITRAMLDFTPLLMEQVMASGQQANDLIGINSPYLPNNMREAISENVQRFAKSMLETDQDILTNIISDGIRQGLSVPQIKDGIKSEFANIRERQAKVITRTEVLRASNGAALDAFKQSGVVEGKQWLTAGAEDECASYEGKIETLDGTFYKSENVFQDGDPPLHPNCKCVLLPVLEPVKTFTITESEREYLNNRIKELEAQIDKRTKAYKDLKKDQREDKEYIKALEDLANAGPAAAQSTDN